MTEDNRDIKESIEFVKELAHKIATDNRTSKAVAMKAIEYASEYDLHTQKEAIAKANSIVQVFKQLANNGHLDLQSLGED